MPFTITAPGIYHLRHDLIVDPGAGAAITVNASEVTINLNGHALTNSGAIPNSSSRGVFALDQAHLTVLNGRLERFAVGISIVDSAPASNNSYGHLIKGVEVGGCTGAGIQISGAGSTVANCRVMQMSVDAAGTEVYGIRMSGMGCRVLDNEVSGSGLMAVDAAQATGICITDAGGNGFVVKNRIDGVGHGIWFRGGAGGPYRNNLVVGASYPFIGGTNAGGNIPAQINENADADQNGLPDLWELRYFGTLGQNPAGDPDGDGLNNLQELQAGPRFCLTAPTA